MERIKVFLDVCIRLADLILVLILIGIAYKAYRLFFPVLPPCA